MLPKRPKKTAARESNPLAARAQELERQEAALAAAREKLERQIEIAPLIKRKREQERREEFVNRASRTRVGNPPTSLPDRRFGYDSVVAAPGQRRRLRAERRQGRLTFFFLLFVLGLVLLYLYWTIIRGGG